MTQNALRLAFAVILAPLHACVIADGGDDDGANDDSDDASASADDSGGTDPTAADSSDPSDGDPADGSGGDSGTDAAPRDGAWVYEETGTPTNDCTFLEEPSNGFGEFQIAITGPDSLLLTPGDETEPFVCTFGGGAFECDERLTGMTDSVAGLDAVGSILVAVDGTFASATSLSGTQRGRIDCEGADCGTAAAALGVTFPCAFTIPFVGTAR